MPTSSSPRRARALVLCLLSLALAACLACSSAGLNPTQGKVTYKGEAIKGAVVVFVAKNAKSNSHHPSGVTGEDGSYSLTTGTKEGAPAGEYVVTITWMEAVTKKARTGKVSMQGDEEE